MVRAPGTVAWELLAFGKQIWIGCIGLSASWRQPWWCALLNVIEDFADEFWIGDVGNDTQLSTAEPKRWMRVTAPVLVELAPALKGVSSISLTVGACPQILATPLRCGIIKTGQRERP
jgi:hypothetical protein